MAYAFTFWTCYVLKREYETVATMRLHFLASEQRRPDQFTVRFTLTRYVLADAIGKLPLMHSSQTQHLLGWTGVKG